MLSLSLSPNHQSLVSTDLFFITIVFSSWKLSYKWNHTVCKLLRLASFTQHNEFKTHPYCCMYKRLFSFYCWVAILCVDVSQTVYAFIPWKTYFSPSRGNDEQNYCKHLCTGFCVNMFSFPRVNIQELDCWVRWDMYV